MKIKPLAHAILRQIDFSYNFNAKDQRARTRTATRMTDPAVRAPLHPLVRQPLVDANLARAPRCYPTSASGRGQPPDREGIADEPPPRPVLLTARHLDRIHRHLPL